MYQLEPSIRVDKWMVAANALELIYGQTKMLRANLMTGETEELPEIMGARRKPDLALLTSKPAGVLRATTPSESTAMA
jgi:hypothetical protein